MQARLGENALERLSRQCHDLECRALLGLVLDAPLGEELTPPPEPKPSDSEAEDAADSEIGSRLGSRRGGRLPPTPPPVIATPTPPAPRSRHALRSEDMAERVRREILAGKGRHMPSSQAAADAIRKADETAAQAMKPLMSADEIRKAIRRPEMRLAHAAARGDAKAVAALLAAGASVGDYDPAQPGWTPLHSAVQSGNLKVVKLLLAHGADPDAADELTGTTPFLWACYCGQQECVREMLLDGAPTAGTENPGPNATRHRTQDSVGRTGLALARVQRHDGVAQVLLTHEASLRTEAKRQRWFEMSREKSAHAGLREAVRAPEPAATKPSGETFVRVD